MLHECGEDAAKDLARRGLAEEHEQDRGRAPREHRPMRQPRAEAREAAGDALVDAGDSEAHPQREPEEEAWKRRNGGQVREGVEVGAVGQRSRGEHAEQPHIPPHRGGRAAEPRGEERKQRQRGVECDLDTERPGHADT